jgi:hypothetical protein
MTRRGLLLTVTEPPPAMEEEFNAWYDTEHLAERLAITGFRSTLRWVADVPPGGGRYLATYELDSAGVLYTPEYLARLNNQSPWSRRCLAKCVVFRRWACEQVEPGDADPHPAAKAVLLFATEAPIDKPSVPGALSARRFVASAGTPAHVWLIELSEPKTHPGAQLYRLYGT